VWLKSQKQPYFLVPLDVLRLLEAGLSRQQQSMPARQRDGFRKRRAQQDETDVEKTDDDCRDQHREISFGSRPYALFCAPQAHTSPSASKFRSPPHKRIGTANVPAFASIVQIPIEALGGVRSRPAAQG
jgi:hypothetical protein